MDAPPYVEGHHLLAGKTVLVTAAAGTGIGFATAKRCVEEGARVVISDAHERRLGEAARRWATPCAASVVCDVTDEDAGAVIVRRRHRGVGWTRRRREQRGARWHRRTSST